MSKVKVMWATPQGEEMVEYIARVSNPTQQSKTDEEHKLIKYLITNNHWSPFEMVNVCMEIETTRDIARQILRHRSFSFQEFSQRYAEAFEWEKSEVRLQDTKNRQSSLATDDRELMRWWNDEQAVLLSHAKHLYKTALDCGIAKEVARKVLPEGLTISRLYMNGTLRSWLHYVDIRTDMGTQKEHREVALQCREKLIELFPNVFEEIIDGRYNNV